MLPRAWQRGTRWTNASTGICGTLGYILLTLPSALEEKKWYLSKLAHQQEYSNTSMPACIAPLQSSECTEIKKDPSPDALLVETPSPAKHVPAASRHSKSLLIEPQSYNSLFNCAAVLWKLITLQPGENR